MEPKLRSLFKEAFVSNFMWIFITVFIVSVIFVSTIANYFWEITLIDIEVDNLIIVIFSGILEIIVLIFSFIVLYPYLCDYKMVKRGECHIIEGMIVDVKFVDDGTETPTTYEYPVIQDDKTGIKITLKKLDKPFKYRERYLIHYLPNTKVGIIVKTYM